MLKLTPATKNKNLEIIAQQKLMPLIPFNEKDLALNDDGFFSDEQKQRLKPQTDLYIALSSIAAFMAFIVALVCFYMGRNSDNYVLITGVFIALFGICFLGINWSLGLARRIKRGYGVKKIEGNVELYITYSGNEEEVPNYNLKIRNVYFRLNRETYYASNRAHTASIISGFFETNSYQSNLSVEPKSTSILSKARRNLMKFRFIR